MPGHVRGQQPLPGDPAALLRAIKDPTPPGTPPAHYVALSVQRSAGGWVRVHKITLDQGSRRVLTELLDSFDGSLPEGRLSDEEILRHWAHEAVLASWDTPV